MLLLNSFAQMGFSLSVLAQDTTFARGVIRYLCSPECAGRGYNQGIDRAADYIAQEMKSMGLKALYAEKYPRNPYTANEFEVSANNFGGNMQVSVNGKMQSAGDNYLPHPASKGIKGVFKVKKIAENQLMDEAKFERLLQKKYSSRYALYLYFTEKNSKALSDKITRLRQKAIAPVLLRPVFGKLTWHISDSVVPCTEIELLSADSLPVPPQKIEVDIDNSQVTNFKTRNLMGIVEGAIQPDTFVVFTAHYDHLGQLGRDKYIPGANDNASGVAMLLNLAKHYAAANPKPYYSMAFVAFSAEELGLVGSQEFAETFAPNPSSPLPQAGFDLSRIKFLVNLDMVGTGDEGITVVNATEFGKRFEQLTRLNDENKYLPQVKARGKAANSDHYPFYVKGVPCFFIYTMGGIKAYHDIYDRSQTLPLTRYNDLFTLLTRFVAQLSPVP